MYVSLEGPTILFEASPRGFKALETQATKSAQLRFGVESGKPRTVSKKLHTVSARKKRIENPTQSLRYRDAILMDQVDRSLRNGGAATAHVSQNASAYMEIEMQNEHLS